MKPLLGGLFSPRGRIDRNRYGVLGAVLVLVKYNLDRWIAVTHGRVWTPLSYWIPNERFSVLTLPRAEWPFYGALALIALPFIWVGLALTVRRLRDAGLPLWLIVLFFPPVVNVLFFLVLSVLPSRAADGGEAEAEEASKTGDDAPLGSAGAPLPSLEADPGGTGRRSSFLAALMPDSTFGSALLSVALTLLLCLFPTLLGVSVLQNYGWGLFIGVPFVLGLVSAVLHGSRTRRTFGQCVGVAMAAMGLGCVVLLAVAVEGVICLMMAAPVVITLGLIGAGLGYLIQDRFHPPDRGGSTASRLYVSLFVALPLFLSLEALSPHAPHLLAVRTGVVVDAPPERVWPHVIAFSELPAPRDWVFRTGIAYPQRARIDGRGVGAVRHCVFSTGPFVEPITVWDTNRRLAFNVVAQPPAMRELSPYGAIHPPHLDNFLRSERGQFLLTPLPGGRTRLEGTTWYRHRIWPERYWRLWSDAIIHRIHRRVLDHVRTLSEE